MNVENKHERFITFRILTPYEAKSLVALLHSKDGNTLEKALVTVSNSAAFTTNQVCKSNQAILIKLSSSDQ